MIRHGRLVSKVCVSLWLLLSLSACGKDREGWASFPIPIYADATVNSSADRADFEDAMAFWENKAGRKLFDFRGVWSASSAPYTGAIDNPDSIVANVVFFLDPWAFGSTVAGRTTIRSSSDGIESSMIMINPDTPSCSGDCVGDPYRASRRKVFTHELGHFLGMGHVSDPANIMNPDTTPGGSLRDQRIDAEALARLTRDS
jgi:hypothetical protein